MDEQNNTISDLRIILVSYKFNDGWCPNFLVYCYHVAADMDNDSLISIAKEESKHICDKERGFKLFAITREPINATIETGNMVFREHYSCFWRHIDLKNAIWKSNNKKTT